MSEAGVKLSERFSQLGPRVRTAAILIVGFLLLDTLAAFTCIGRWAAFVVALALVAAAALETAVFTVSSGIARRAVVAGTILLPTIVIGVYLSALHTCDTTVAADASILVAVKSAVVGMFVACGVALGGGHRSLDVVSERMRELPLAMFLIGIGGGALVALPLLPGGAWILLWLVIVVAVNDTAAYFVGSRLGGPKLCPAVSPNKTLSGSLGGLIAGALVGVLSGSLSTAESWTQSLPLAVVVVLAAQVGDLAKSYLKRLHGVKDSGRLLPGHGGVLDRIDGILAGGLVVYVWAVGAW